MEDENGRRLPSWAPTLHSQEAQSAGSGMHDVAREPKHVAQSDAVRTTAFMQHQHIAASGTDSARVGGVPILEC